MLMFLNQGIQKNNIRKCHQTKGHGIEKCRLRPIYCLRILPGLLISEDYFQLFKFLWLLVSDFTEIV